MTQWFDVGWQIWALRFLLLAMISAAPASSWLMRWFWQRRARGRLHRLLGQHFTLIAIERTLIVVAFFSLPQEIRLGTITHFQWFQALIAVLFALNMLSLLLWAKGKIK